MPLSDWVGALRGCWQALLACRPGVLKQGVEQRVVQALEPMGPRQVGIFF